MKIRVGDQGSSKTSTLFTLRNHLSRLDDKSPSSSNSSRLSMSKSLWCSFLDHHWSTLALQASFTSSSEWWSCSTASARTRTSCDESIDSYSVRFYTVLAQSLPRPLSHYSSTRKYLKQTTIQTVSSSQASESTLLRSSASYKPLTRSFLISLQWS